jgi:hypothetical protein
MPDLPVPDDQHPDDGLLDDEDWPEGHDDTLTDAHRGGDDGC